MLELLSGLDESLFHAINGAWPSGDTMMWWTSKPLAWAPLYVLLIIAVLKKYKSRASRLLVLAGVGITVGLCDLVSARVLKPTAERLRPSHRVEFVDSIHLYERADGIVYKGGKYSFVSSHAANHMGVAIFLGAVLSGWLWWLVLWAVVIGYSRIHLGVHFPGDVICGWMVGAGLGAVVFNVIRRRL